MSTYSRYFGHDFHAKQRRTKEELFPPSSVKPVAEAIPGAQVFTYASILGHLGCALDLQKATEAGTDFLKRSGSSFGLYSDGGPV